jgi:hypothetical protein
VHPRPPPPPPPPDFSPTPSRCISPHVSSTKKPTPTPPLFPSLQAGQANTQNRPAMPKVGPWRHASSETLRATAGNHPPLHCPCPSFTTPIDNVRRRRRCGVGGCGACAHTFALVHKPNLVLPLTPCHRTPDPSANASDGTHLGSPATQTPSSLPFLPARPRRMRRLQCAQPCRRGISQHTHACMSHWYLASTQWPPEYPKAEFCGGAIYAASFVPQRSDTENDCGRLRRALLSWLCGGTVPAVVCGRWSQP